MEVARTGRQATAQSGMEVMAETRQMAVIDDDELSRELLSLLVAEAGFRAKAFASGEEALVWLRDREQVPAVVLTDMQMPGISGAELAVWLREACGPGTILLAMSGSTVGQEKLEQFDGFLLKPFSAEDLNRACDVSRKTAAVQEEAAQEATGQPAGTAGSLNEPILNEVVYQKFAQAMQAVQLAGLYQMCLDDARKRVETMRRALEVGDDGEYRRAAHAIKGGCGMVGATELHRLATEMETNGLTLSAGNVPNPAPLDLFLTASARLGRMLENKAADA